VAQLDEQAVQHDQGPPRTNFLVPVMFDVKAGGKDVTCVCSLRRLGMDSMSGRHGESSGKSIRA
jgi:hypothetical protein